MKQVELYIYSLRSIYLVSEHNFQLTLNSFCSQTKSNKLIVEF
jgi:hypothetical protein